jgi:hypothetical protein
VSGLALGSGILAGAMEHPARPHCQPSRTAAVPP